MCFKPQKSIRISEELCDAIQAYALSNRLALKPRWFSDFINSAVREKLIRDGFLSDNSNHPLASGSASGVAVRSTGISLSDGSSASGVSLTDNAVALSSDGANSKIIPPHGGFADCRAVASSSVLSNEKEAL